MRFFLKKQFRPFFDPSIHGSWVRDCPIRRFVVEFRRLVSQEEAEHLLRQVGCTPSGGCGEAVDDRRDADCSLPEPVGTIHRPETRRIWMRASCAGVGLEGGTPEGRRR